MRVFIGTLECGENQFQQCCSVIYQQIDINFEHFVVSGLPEKDAHEALFSRWNEVKNDYDLFLKVDADTELSSKEVVKTYVDLFSSNENLTGVQAWLHDHMTDDLIFGLTCVKNTVTVATRVDKLYCDKVDSNHKIVLRGNDLPEKLRPAGYHCKNSSDIQAFHYGYHRGKKNQHSIRDRVFKAWKRDECRDRARALALIGFQMSSLSDALNYNDKEFQQLYFRALKDYDLITKSLV
jgi:hypothetical protein